MLCLHCCNALDCVAWHLIVPGVPRHGERFPRASLTIRHDASCLGLFKRLHNMDSTTGKASTRRTEDLFPRLFQLQPCNARQHLMPSGLDSGGGMATIYKTNASSATAQAGWCMFSNRTAIMRGSCWTRMQQGSTCRRLITLIIQLIINRCFGRCVGVNPKGVCRRLLYCVTLFGARYGTYGTSTYGLGLSLLSTAYVLVCTVGRSF